MPTGLMRELRHLRGIVAAAPEVDGDVIATYGTKTLNVSVLGIEPEEQLRVTTIGKDIVEGSFTRASRHRRRRHHRPRSFRSAGREAGR